MDMMEEKEENVLSHFGRLDELIQVVYQGFHRFVVLSSVSASSWTIHVGLKGPEGRWWRGSWSERDIMQFIGPKSNSNVLDSFAHNVCETFVDGELCIGDWAPDQGTKINLTLGPTSKKPIHVPLVELSAKEAASHATAIFSAIALQAQQSRKCRLHPPAFSAAAQSAAAGPSSSHEPAATDSGRSRHSKSKRPRAPEPVAPVADEDRTSGVAVAQQKIASLEAELAQVKAAKKAKSRSPGASETDPQAMAPSIRRPKGASLANPYKKARKYQAVEFESDNE